MTVLSICYSPGQNKNSITVTLLFYSLAEKESLSILLQEAAVYKVVNRQKYLEISQDGAVEKDDIVISLLADLQQEQDQESEKLVNEMQDKVTVLLTWYWVSCGNGS